MSGEAVTRQVRRWQRPRWIRDPRLRWLFLAGIFLYLGLALLSLDVNWGRISMGMERTASMFAGFLRPDFLTRWSDIFVGVLESLTMTVVATVLGVVLALPVAFGAAANISPLPVYLISRGFITTLRSFQEVIIAILFVVMIGFGPLAGTLTLAVSSVGFLGKLLSEEIEGMDKKQMEAIRATGASWLQVMLWAVWPQIKPRFVGLGVYRFDINFRESAVIGVVGAGGIGSSLTTAFDRYDFSLASAILIVIVAIVLVTEYASGLIRRAVQ